MQTRGGAAGPHRERLLARIEPIPVATATDPAGPWTGLPRPCQTTKPAHQLVALPFLPS